MKKIISLFKRDYEGTRLVYDEVVPGAEWVTAGKGIATVKYDGTSCMIRDNVLYKRYDRKLKKGKYKSAPEGWEAAQEPDPKTGHWPGWVPVGDGPEDKWHREAMEHHRQHISPPARPYPPTYELVGPKVQRNLYHLVEHQLVSHGYYHIIPDPPRNFGDLRAYLEEAEIEGIVWHHPDGRMVKIKRKDFGWAWPPKES